MAIPQLRAYLDPLLIAQRTRAFIMADLRAGRLKPSDAIKLAVRLSTDVATQRGVNVETVVRYTIDAIDAAISSELREKAGRV